MDISIINNKKSNSKQKWILSQKVNTLLFHSLYIRIVGYFIIHEVELCHFLRR